MQTVPLVLPLYPVLAPDSGENKHKKNTNWNLGLRCAVFRVTEKSRPVVLSKHIKPECENKSLQWFHVKKKKLPYQFAKELLKFPLYLTQKNGSFMLFALKMILAFILPTRYPACLNHHLKPERFLETWKLLSSKEIFIWLEGKEFPSFFKLVGLGPVPT